MERQLGPQDIAELKVEKLGHEIKIREINSLLSGEEPEERTVAVAPHPWEQPLYPARWIKDTLSGSQINHHQIHITP